LHLFLLFSLFDGINIQPFLVLSIVLPNYFQIIFTINKKGSAALPPEATKKKTTLLSPACKGGYFLLSPVSDPGLTHTAAPIPVHFFLFEDRK